MGEQFWMSKETFLRIAEECGLDTTDQHMEELYAFLQGLLPSLRDIEEFDLAGVEPFMPSMHGKGGGE